MSTASPPRKRKNSAAPDAPTHSGRLKDELISAVSHELRTPLTSIHGALALVMSGAAGPLPGKARDLLAVAHRNSERLVHIVNDILDAEKINSGKMRLTMQKIPLAAFLQQAITYNEPYAEKFKVRFVLQGVPAGAEIAADPDRLMQVVTNLLSNAAKFSPPGSDIAVRARAAAGKIVIEVEDCGPGIPKEFQPHIFEKFAQAQDPAAPKREGAGLGLSLSKQLVELMHGEIGFHTLPAKGTVFFIRLDKDPKIPAAHPHEAA